MPTHKAAPHFPNAAQGALKPPTPLTDAIQPQASLKRYLQTVPLFSARRPLIAVSLQRDSY